MMNCQVRILSHLLKCCNTKSHHCLSGSSPSSVVTFAGWSPVGSDLAVVTSDCLYNVPVPDWGSAWRVDCGDADTSLTSPHSLWQDSATVWFSPGNSSMIAFAKFRQSDSPSRVASVLLAVADLEAGHVSEVVLGVDQR